MELRNQEELFAVLERGVPIDDATISFPAFFMKTHDFKITFLNAKFIDSVIFETTLIPNHVLFEGCIFRKGLSIDESEINRLMLLNCIMENISYQT